MAPIARTSGAWACRHNAARACPLPVQLTSLQREAAALRQDLAAARALQDGLVKELGLVTSRYDPDQGQYIASHIAVPSLASAAQRLPCSSSSPVRLPVAGTRACTSTMRRSSGAGAARPARRPASPCPLWAARPWGRQQRLRPGWGGVLKAWRLQTARPVTWGPALGDPGLAVQPPRRPYASTWLPRPPPTRAGGATSPLALPLW